MAGSDIPNVAAKQASFIVDGMSPETYFLGSNAFLEQNKGVGPREYGYDVQDGGINRRLEKNCTLRGFLICIFRQILFG